jgi:hypothetical protein
MANEVYEELLESIREDSDEDFEDLFGDEEAIFVIMMTLTEQQRLNVLVEKNIRIFKGVNEYAKEFLTKTTQSLARMEEGKDKELVKAGQRKIVEALLKKDGLTAENKNALNKALVNVLVAAPAAGGFKMPRKMTRKYCKKTPCKKMGFTQRASCRPWKNCYKNKK